MTGSKRSANTCRREGAPVSSLMYFHVLVKAYHAGNRHESGLVVDDDDRLIPEKTSRKHLAPLERARLQDSHGTLLLNFSATLTAVRLNKKILPLRF